VVTGDHESLIKQPVTGNRKLNMPIYYYIWLSIALFIIGITGVLTRRNAIIIFMCIELMLNAVNLLLVAFSKMHNLEALENAKKAGLPITEAILNVGTDGQLFVFFIMVVAAAEVSVGLAIIVMMYRNVHSVDVGFLNRLKH
jgi:NADH-quinone oxidoreductase subunit K